VVTLLYRITNACQQIHQSSNKETVWRMSLSCHPSNTIIPKGLPVAHDRVEKPERKKTITAAAPERLQRVHYRVSLAIIKAIVPSDPHKEPSCIL